MSTTNFDVVINVVEINNRHGVGILLQRIFQNSSRVITIRTLNLYGRDQAFGVRDLVIGKGTSRSTIRANIQQALSGQTIGRILCIPYHVEEVFAALAVKELSGADICTYLMDDQNILTDGIPNPMMSELLLQSSICLAISPEMRDVYQVKYDVPIYFAPPVIPAKLVKVRNLSNPEISESQGRKKVGAILGNIWSPRWLELLRSITKESGVQLDWYGNTGADWNFNDREQLSADGITERGFLPTEAEVATVIQTYDYVVVPSGTLDFRDDNAATSWLSLPSRIPFILATTQTPIIVLGSPSTAAARFVLRFGIGIVSEYDTIEFQAAVAEISQTVVQDRLRANAAKIADRFVNEQMDEWIWRSMSLGKPVDDRFETLLTESADYTIAFATCLDIIREQQLEINRLKFKLKPLCSPIEYLQDLSHRWSPLRRIWLKLKGQF